MAKHKNLAMYGLLLAGAGAAYWYFTRRKADGVLYLDGTVNLAAGKRYELSVEHTAEAGKAWRTGELAADLQNNPSLCVNPFDSADYTTFRMTPTVAKALTVPFTIQPGVVVVGVQEVKSEDGGCLTAPQLVA